MLDHSARREVGNENCIELRNDFGPHGCYRPLARDGTRSKLSGGKTWQGIAQPVEHDADPAHSENPSFKGASPQGTSQRGFVVMPYDPEAAKIKPHYEWQYHYSGRHAHWEGHWTLVTAPIQSAKPPTIATR